ncbi:gastric triacylglycerol lipase-like [Tropilaelaps mercedesae]|uniref:Gastric triacylglycerol lipase-like n=1 Tax=Tropilaelaps mercedesae TaxID=418985 RepID=A0A1V9XBB3_9ACAR|nr:gastric triacylglycerol lipase-like [Tropilaelaps mercedesae]
MRTRMYAKTLALPLLAIVSVVVDASPLVSSDPSTPTHYFGDYSSDLNFEPLEEDFLDDHYNSLHYLEFRAQDPDAYLNVTQIIKRWDYPVENHIITTKDGYILREYLAERLTTIFAHASN